MSRDDLFSAITDPNLEVSPAFQTIAVVTSARPGLSRAHRLRIAREHSAANWSRYDRADYQCRAIIDAPDHAIVDAQALLDPLSDQEISDLYAYLRGLR